MLKVCALKRGLFEKIFYHGRGNRLGLQCKIQGHNQSRTKIKLYNVLLLFYFIGFNCNFKQT